MKLTRFIPHRANAITTLGFGLETNHFERCIQKGHLTQARMEGLAKKNELLFPKLVFIETWRGGRKRPKL